MDRENQDKDKLDVTLEDSGEITVVYPENVLNIPEAKARFEEETRQKLADEANGKETKDRHLPNLYKNQAELKRLLAEKEAENERLKNNKPATTEPANPGNPGVSAIKPIHERLGLKSEDDLDDPDNYSPKAYRKAQEDYFNELSEFKAKQMLDNVVKNSQATAQQSILAARMVQEGNKPEEFQAWLKYQQNEGVPLQFNEGAYRLWKQAKADKSDPILAAQAFSQDMKIKFVAPGNVKPINFDTVTEKDIATMMRENPQQYAAYKNYLIEKATR